MIIDTYSTALGSKRFGEGAARAVVICMFLSAFALLYFHAVTRLSKRMTT